MSEQVDMDLSRSSQCENIAEREGSAARLESIKRVATSPIEQQCKLRKLTTCPSGNSDSRGNGMDESVITGAAVESENRANSVGLEEYRGTDNALDSSHPSASERQTDNYKCNISDIPDDTSTSEVRKDGLDMSATNERGAVESENSVETLRGQCDNVELVQCGVCKIPIKKNNRTSHLRSNKHNDAATASYLENVSILGSAFKKRIVTFRIKPSVPQESDFGNSNEFFKSIEDTFLCLLRDMVKRHISIKVNFILSGTFVQPTKDSTSDFDFQSKNSAICSGESLETFFKSICATFAIKIEDFERKDSGWSLKNILHLDVNVNKYKPFSGSSYIELSEFIRKKKAVINVQNKDNKCFTYALLSALYPAEKKGTSHRPGSYRSNFSKINMKGIEYPVSLADVRKVEKLNNISVNIFTLEENKKGEEEIVGPVYHTKDRKTKHINLLYITDGVKEHYCYIKNMSRLINSQLNSTEHQRYFCDGCLIGFTSEEKLRAHMKFDCVHVRVVMPNIIKDPFGREVKSNVLKFEGYNKQLKVPFVIYADFEAFLSPINNENEHESMNQDKTEPEVSKYVQKHEVYSFAYYVKCSYDDGLSRYKTYRGIDCVKVFFETLGSDVKEICDVLNGNISMIDLSPDEKKSFKKAIKCYLCNGPLNGDSVRDHDHLTGKFRGAAHANCNLNNKVPNYIPIFLHNLSNYDAHFIVHGLNFASGDIELIALNKEKYISFTKKIKINRNTVKLRFLDSFRFMSSSLEVLAKNLEREKFIELRRLFPVDDDFSLLIRKGIYPYEFISCFEDLNNTTSLPAQKDFYNHLNDTTVSDDDYNHALRVWSHFKCKDMGEYSDLYLKTDVLLLTDIFENFRSLCMDTYSLDPAHYYTLPGLSWDAMLKLTEIELELLTDYEMLAFVKKGIRGGISQCSNRHAKANNKYLPDFDSEVRESYITYLDANNLYGWAMSKPLPYGDFHWVHENDIDKTNFEVPDTSDVGYILEVDLTYPTKLHDNHSDLPFCPEQTETPTCKEKRLINNLNSKQKYIIHHQNLVQCLQHGLELTKVYRILQFKQKPWLKAYIDLNTSKRAQAKSSFDKDFYKLMNNSVYGKTMENIEKYKNIKLVTHWENNGKKLGAIGLIKKPEFHSSTEFSENLVAVQLKKTKLFYNKPIYLGLCVLDLSKTLMYRFHYDYMKNKYGENIKLMYMDTDSFIYQVFAHDYYADIKHELSEHFDTSGYEPDNHFGYPLVNKKEIGFFKDEFNGSIVKEFVGLRSKLYAMDVHDKKLITKAKGVNKCVTAKLTMSEFSDSLTNKSDISKEMYRFKSDKHIIYTQKLKKKALSSNDCKRFLIPDSYDTLAWGHYRINSYQT